MSLYVNAFHKPIHPFLLKNLISGEKDQSMLQILVSTGIPLNYQKTEVSVDTIYKVIKSAAKLARIQSYCIRFAAISLKTFCY